MNLATLKGQLHPSMFVGGLLHDIGALLVYLVRPDKARDILIETENRGAETRMVEREQLGVDHSELGAQLQIAWELPDLSVQIARYHHTPSEAPASAQDAVDLVHLADVAVSALRIGNAGERSAHALDDGAWERSGAPPGLRVRGTRGTGGPRRRHRDCPADLNRFFGTLRGLQSGVSDSIASRTTRGPPKGASANRCVRLVPQWPHHTRRHSHLGKFCSMPYLPRPGTSGGPMSKAHRVSPERASSTRAALTTGVGTDAQSLYGNSFVREQLEAKAIPTLNSFAARVYCDLDFRFWNDELRALYDARENLPTDKLGSGEVKIQYFSSYASLKPGMKRLVDHHENVHVQGARPIAAKFKQAIDAESGPAYGVFGERQITTNDYIGAYNKYNGGLRECLLDEKAAYGSMIRLAKEMLDDPTYADEHDNIRENIPGGKGTLACLPIVADASPRVGVDGVRGLQSSALAGGRRRQARQ